MQPSTVTRVRSWNPNGVALRAMGLAARRAGDTWTMREWAARLATRAGPKDYRGQLRELYDGIVKRWRYVMESGEVVMGTAKAVLGHTLGAKYNCGPKCPDPEHCDVEATQWQEFGFGDCDDVATLAAAGVLALGMTPYWRVSVGPMGAHVAVTAFTPRGQRVELDPVVYPEHGFDWAPSGPGIRVKHFTLEGAEKHMNMGAYTPNWGTGMQSFVPTYMGADMSYMGTAAPSPMDLQPTMVGELMVGPNGTWVPYQAADRNPHLCAVHPSDMMGPRVLACPAWHARMMRRGLMWHGTPAIDQFGKAWRYNGDMDVWLPAKHTMSREWTPAYEGAPGTNAAAWAWGQYLGAGKAARRAKRKAKRKKRRKRRRAMLRKAGKKVGRFVKKVGKGVRKVVGKILSSKFVQTIVAGVLQVFGVPMVVTKKLLAVAGKFIGDGGFGKLLKLARKSPKEAMRFLASAVKGAGRSDLLKKFKIPGFSGASTNGLVPMQFEVQQGMGSFYAAPVEAVVGLPGVYEMGLDVVDTDVATPGYWYRVQKGDTLSSVSKEAFGPENALTHQKWINAAQANAGYLRPTDKPYNNKHFGPEIVSFRPIFAKEPAAAIAGESGNYYALLWVPPAEGVEPQTEPVIDYDDDDAPEPDVPNIEDVPDAGPMPMPEDDVDDEDVDVVPPMPPLGPVVPPQPGPEPVVPPRPDDPQPDEDRGEPPIEPADEDDGGRLKPIPWPDPQPEPAANDGGGGAAIVAGLGLLLTLL